MGNTASDFQKRWCEIEEKRERAVAELILEAVAKGINVCLVVGSGSDSSDDRIRPTLAQSYFSGLRLDKNKHCHVVPRFCEDALSIPFERPLRSPMELVLQRAAACDKKPDKTKKRGSKKA